MEATAKATHQSEILESKNSSGRRKFWRGEILDMGGGAFATRTVWWQELADGSLSFPQYSEPRYAAPKNVGKRNETTSEQQAFLDLESLINKQRRKGYHLDGEKAELPLPMLAQTYGKRKSGISYPCYVQPKLDGNRAVYDPEIGFWSRQGKLYIKEVVQHLEWDTGGLVLDGEIILAEEAGGFQKTNSAIKRYQADLSPFLEFHVFDIMDPDSDFEQRFIALLTLFRDSEGIRPDRVKLVPTHVAYSESEMRDLHGLFMEQGYEGTILRDAHTLYAINQRSPGLQKYKDFVDDEFLVVDVIDGEAKEAGCAIFVCRTSDGNEFTVRPKGSIEDRREMFAKRSELIGRELTVRYQNLTDAGIPRFPVGVGIRDRTLQG